eukprot:GILJ01011233.1.p1 GENE.GILJ01011233.1~~GILJ01011233.1.p1  ORF type:complete len:1188 (-),score=193.55 GILJ01011233.1:103-3666(-)
MDSQHQPMPVGIFWDIENTGIPSNVRPEMAAFFISSYARTIGPIVAFNAYGNLRLFRDELRMSLHQSGVHLCDVAGGIKEAADKAILVDMFLFALDNGTPATIVLLTSDADFSPAMHKLRQRGYRFLLIRNTDLSTAAALSLAGDDILDLSLLVHGEFYKGNKAKIFSIVAASSAVQSQCKKRFMPLLNLLHLHAKSQPISFPKLATLLFASYPDLDEPSLPEYLQAAEKLDLIRLDEHGNVTVVQKRDRTVTPRRRNLSAPRNADFSRTPPSPQAPPPSFHTTSFAPTSANNWSASGPASAGTARYGDRRNVTYAPSIAATPSVIPFSSTAYDVPSTMASDSHHSQDSTPSFPASTLYANGLMASPVSNHHAPQPPSAAERTPAIGQSMSPLTGLMQRMISVPIAPPEHASNTPNGFFHEEEVQSHSPEMNGSLTARTPQSGSPAPDQLGTNNQDPRVMASFPASSPSYASASSLRPSVNSGAANSSSASPTPIQSLSPTPPSAVVPVPSAATAVVSGTSKVPLVSPTSGTASGDAVAALIDIVKEFAAKGVLQPMSVQLGPLLKERKVSYSKLSNLLNAAAATNEVVVRSNPPPFVRYRYSKKVPTATGDFDAELQQHRFTTQVVSVNVPRLTQDALFWTLQSFQLDEMLPVDVMVKNRLAQVYRIEIKAAMWRDLMKACAQSERFEVEVGAKTYLFPRAQRWTEASLDKMSISTEVALEQLGQFLDVELRQCDYAIVGGKYALARLLQKFGPPSFKKMSVGLVVQVVKLAMERQLIGYGPTGSPGNNVLIRFKNLRNSGPSVPRTVTPLGDSQAPQPSQPQPQTQLQQATEQPPEQQPDSMHSAAVKGEETDKALGRIREALLLELSQQGEQGLELNQAWNVFRGKVMSFDSRHYGFNTIKALLETMPDALPLTFFGDKMRVVHPSFSRQPQPMAQAENELTERFVSQSNQQAVSETSWKREQTSEQALQQAAVSLQRVDSPADPFDSADFNGTGKDVEAVLVSAQSPTVPAAAHQPATMFDTEADPQDKPSIIVAPVQPSSQTNNLFDFDSEPASLQEEVEVIVFPSRVSHELTQTSDLNNSTFAGANEEAIFFHSPLKQRPLSATDLSTAAADVTVDAVVSRDDFSYLDDEVQQFVSSVYSSTGAPSPVSVSDVRMVRDASPTSNNDHDIFCDSLLDWKSSC